MVDIQQITYSELSSAPNFDALVAEYRAEAGAQGLPTPRPTDSIYLSLEAAGMLTIHAAFVDNELAGFIFCNLARLPQYGGSLVASEMSFFVASAYRKTGAGKALFIAAEQSAKDNGAIAFVITAKPGSVFARVVERWGFAETVRMYLKPLC